MAVWHRAQACSYRGTILPSIACATYRLLCAPSIRKETRSAHTCIVRTTPCHPRSEVSYRMEVYAVMYALSRPSLASGLVLLQALSRLLRIEMHSGSSPGFHPNRLELFCGFVKPVKIMIPYPTPAGSVVLGGLKGHEPAVRRDHGVRRLAALVVVEVREPDEILARAVELQLPDVDVAGAAPAARVLALPVGLDGRCRARPGKCPPARCRCRAPSRNSSPARSRDRSPSPKPGPRGS